ncbi:MAG: electron transport complex subunit RsxC [Nanoarchaeota archaeon]|nr:electron transport complex subunit RsxC [Nanoarchaeota archaeon]
MKAIGGIHPNYNKFTSKSKIEVAPSPKLVILPLSQHIGAPCEPLVNVGDTVKVGQKIAEAKAFVSAPIHSSISGTVKKIEDMPHPVLGKCKAIIIESDGKIDWDPTIKQRDNPMSLDKEELKNMIKEAGIVGMGGATFPTHVKLSPPKEKPINILILNGAECEPYLTCDHKLMIEKCTEIIKGALIIKKILDVQKVVIGVEDNKENAILVLREKIEEMNADIKVIALPTSYPQGAEKTLIYTVTGKVVPAGGLPMDVGAVVQNVSTAKAVYDAVYESKPLIERVVTVTGAVNDRKNLLVKIGTPVKQIIEFCGGYSGAASKLISGGPMMGIAQCTEDIPVLKGSSGILVLAKQPEAEEFDCIRCGKCVEACPMQLMPTTIAQYAEKDMIEKADEYNAADCIECGCCSYVCPSKIPLVQKIKIAKNQILADRKKK